MMKKKSAAFIAAILVFALAIGVWFYAYCNQKINDNLPSLAAIAAKGEAYANEVLPGYQRNQLAKVWGDPDNASSNEDFWMIDGVGVLRVSYNNRETVVVCGISPDTNIVKE